MCLPCSLRHMEGWPEPGTPVKLVVRTWAGLDEHIGVAIPSAGQDLVTIKLVNGYNLSFPSSYVEEFQVMGEIPEIKEEESEQIAQDESLPLVHLIHTGGTIASKVDYSTGAVTARFEPSELLQAVPELRSIARIRAVKLGNMWSDDIRPRHWNRMLKATEEAFAEGAVGVVITHGTDTLHLSARQWHTGGRVQGRPPGRIVLTGSQRSPDRGSSTLGEPNLGCLLGDPRPCANGVQGLFCCSRARVLFRWQVRSPPRVCLQKVPLIEEGCVQTDQPGTYRPCHFGPRRS